MAIEGAQYFVAKIYALGQGTILNYDLAREWCLKAAAQEQTDAMNTLGSMYAGGYGVDRDAVQALKWWRIADSLGNHSEAGNIARITDEMTPDQINAAEKLAKDWHAVTP